MPCHAQAGRPRHAARTLQVAGAGAGGAPDSYSDTGRSCTPGAMAAAASISRKIGASVISAKRLCSARSRACSPAPVAYQPKISRCLNVSAYWSRFCSKVSRSKSGAPSAAARSTTSKEFETSTERPAWCPSRHPTTRGMAAAPGSRARMQWSLMLMSTSCTHTLRTVNPNFRECGW